nr:MAG TPA: hypothetical protein [Caudoviricetes sp.]
MLYNRQLAPIVEETMRKLLVQRLFPQGSTLK